MDSSKNRSYLTGVNNFGRSLGLDATQIQRSIMNKIDFKLLLDRTSTEVPLADFEGT